MTFTACLIIVVAAILLFSLVSMLRDAYPKAFETFFSLLLFCFLGSCVVYLLATILYIILHYGLGL